MAEREKRTKGRMASKELDREIAVRKTALRRTQHP
jgi:hypothetical protein